MAFSVDFSIPGRYCLKETESGAESSRTCVFCRQNGEELFFRFECKENYFYPKHYAYNEPLYEGDIVECFNDGLSEVLFRKGNFGMLTYTSKGVDFYTFNEVYGVCEIIGNIYENPDLLEREPQ